MNQPITKLLLAIFLLSSLSCSRQDVQKVEANVDPMDQAVEKLLAQMTVEEKAGQMTQVALDLVLKGTMYNAQKPYSIDPEGLATAIDKYKVGSILNVAGEALTVEQWRTFVGAIQGKAMEGRIKIPVLYGIDAIHGTNYTQGSTLYPQQIGLAAARDPQLVIDLCRITAYETRASCIPWTFAPALDVCRNPLWPRLWESFGEDPFLNAEMGAATVLGFQGEPGELNRPDRIVACLKHFAGYGFPLSGKDRTPAWIPERNLREYVLPPYKAAIEAGARTIMVNSGEINGIPTHTDDWLLQDILRDELGFTGIVLTDWEDIKYLHTRHLVAPTQKEAVRMAIEAGIDMSMVPDDYSFTEHLIALVKEGSIPESRLDESVRRILKVKFELGLFDQPVIDDSFDYTRFGQGEQLALEAARETITLLKNEGNQLPLSLKNQRGGDKKFLVTGLTANSMRALNGGWSYTWQGDRSDSFAAGENTLLEALRDKIADENLLYSVGCNDSTIEDWESTAKLAEMADHIILCLGELSYTEFVGNIDDLVITAGQTDLAQRLIATGKPITLVLLEGRPRIISHFSDDIPGIVLGYLPGNQGGQAITEVLFGDHNPSGRLPYTYPRYTGSLVPYDYKNAETIGIQGTAFDVNYHFPFGHGLSYTSFVYSSLQVTSSVAKGGTVKVTVTVSNEGQRAGSEIIDVFTRDHYASITPANKRLRAFTKIELQPGERKTVEIDIPVDRLAFVGRDNEWTVENGKFDVMVGGLTAAFEVVD